MNERSKLLSETSDRLIAIINQARSSFDKIGESEWLKRPAPGKWSKKEILGHLTDSAANNHLRFVRAQLAEIEYVSFAYEQDFFVKSQNYQDYPTVELISLWHSYNHLLAHVIRNADPSRLSVSCKIGRYEPAPLSFLITDYADHLKHHVDDILLKRYPMQTDTEIQIVHYKPEHRTRFKEINEQWITKSFVMEEEDIKTLEDPESYILKNGGRIYIALYKGEAAGTCAYLNFGNHTYEMIKMAVDEKFRGLKIGKVIGEYSMQEMRSSGAKTVFLYSNTKGSAVAINLYRNLGFKEIPLGNSEFQRADIKMEIHF
jgi:ribosomal protein S18 acetylase RimI-like enzyme